MPDPTSPYRPGLPVPPLSIRRLPVHRGYPVPWFVAWQDDVPEFRVADAAKVQLAVRSRLCWVCGEKLGKHRAFVVGPMCAVNRISSEPPSHVACADFSASACPFLTRPHMERREAGMPAEARRAPGVMIERNPGVALVWITDRYQLVGPRGRQLFEMGPPAIVHAFAEGRRATPDEIAASVTSGLPALLELAEAQGTRAVQQLGGQLQTAWRLLGLPRAALPPFPPPAVARGPETHTEAQ